MLNYSKFFCYFAMLLIIQSYSSCADKSGGDEESELTEGLDTENFQGVQKTLQPKITQSAPGGSGQYSNKGVSAQIQSQSWEKKISEDENDELSEAFGMILGNDNSDAQGEENSGDISPESLAEKVSLNFAKESYQEGSDTRAILEVTYAGTENTGLSFRVELFGNAEAGTDFSLSSPNISFESLDRVGEFVFDFIDDDQFEVLKIVTVKVWGNKTGEQEELVGESGFYLSDDDAAPVQSDLVWHFDPNDLASVYAEGSSVSSWQDSANLGAKASQSNASAQPIFDGNGLRFDGVDDFLIISNSNDININGPYLSKQMFFAIETSDDIARRQVIFEQGGGTRGLNLYIDNGQLVFGGWNLANDDRGATTPWGSLNLSYGIAPNHRYIASLRYDFTSDLIELRINGEASGTLSGAGKLFNHSGDVALGGMSAANQTYFHDGTIGTNDVFFKGAIFEFLYLNVIIDPQQTEQYLIDKYLGSKPNLSLSFESNAAYEDVAESSGVKLRIYRDKPGFKDLPFSIVYSGTAQPLDFSGLPLEGVIPALASYVDLSFSVASDTEKEGNETLFAGLAAHEAFNVLGGEAALDIIDDDVFSPLGDVIFWLNSEAKNLQHSSGSVSVWNDHGQNGFAATQSNASRQPFYDPNSLNPIGLSPLVFDGANDFLTMADDVAVNTGGPYESRSLFVAFKTSGDVNSRQMIFEEGGSTRGLSLYIHQGLIYAAGWNLANDDGGSTTPWAIAYASAPLNANTEYTAIFVYDFTVDSIKLYLNGLEVGNASGVGRLFAHGDDTGIGAVNGSTKFHDGVSSSGHYLNASLYHLILFQNALSEAEREHLSNYYSP